MILFKPEMARKIIDDEKWETRRMWFNPRCKRGSLHNAQLSLKPESCFARLLILDIWEWDGFSITAEQGKAEGFERPEEFFGLYRKLNEKRMKEPGRKHYAVKFKTVFVCPECKNRLGCESHNLFPRVDTTICGCCRVEKPSDENFDGGNICFECSPRPLYVCCLCNESKNYSKMFSVLFSRPNRNVCRDCAFTGVHKHEV